MEDDNPATDVGKVTLDEDYGQGGVYRKDQNLPQLSNSYVPGSEIWCLTVLSKFDTKFVEFLHFAHLVSCSPFPQKVFLDSWSH